MKKIPNNQKPKGLMIRNSTAEFLMFTANSRRGGLEVSFQYETVWLTQKLMVELFQCSTHNISLHLKNIFKDDELEEKSVAEEFSVTACDGKQYRTKHYNLDAIIAHENSVSSILEHTAEYEKNILPYFTIFTPLFLLSTVYQQNWTLTDCEQAGYEKV